MDKPLLIKDVTSLKSFERAIKLQALTADAGNPYFKDYILTQDLANLYERILSCTVGSGWGSTASSLPTERRRSHLISAQYGTGKSYFLMILSALLSAAGDRIRLQTARDKFASFREVQALLGQLADKKFLIIQVSAEDKGDIRFKELLVRSLLDQVTKLLPDVTFSNEYTRAINSLEDLELSPIGPAIAQTLDELFGISPQQLRAKLGLYDRNSLRMYYQACERALKVRVSRDVLDVEATFQEALDLLKPKGYTHIAVLVDELTAYLHASAGHHSLAETLNELQTFANYCNSKTSRCLFVAAMHESMQEFLQDQSQQRLYDKTRARFDEHNFPAIYANKLLAGVFDPKQAAFDQAMKGYRGQVEELNGLITTFKMVDDGQPMKLSAFFPLHPSVAHYLPRVSRVLGQAERTSFGFIDEEVRQKLDEPLAVGQRLNLVTLDQVFDYFLSAMEQKEHYLQVIAAYNSVQSKVANPLAYKAFKPLALLWVASRVLSEEAQYLQTDLSSEQVAGFIDEEDDLAVKEALDSLRKTGYVYFDGSTQRYFYSHADPGWDLEKEVQEAMINLDPYEVLRSELQALGSRVCLNVPEIVTVKVDRSIESQWVEIKQLEETASLKPKRADGKIVFVVPYADEAQSYEARFSDVTLKARDLSAANVAVAVPKKVDMLNLADLRRYRALQEIGKRLDIGGQGSTNEHRVRVVRARFSETQGRVEHDVVAFGQESNFIFFIKRQPQEAEDLATILEDMFERYYYRFPKVKVERINGRGTTNALIEGCMVNPKTSFAGDTSEVARQARDTLQVLGLCTWEKAGGGRYDVELTEPKPGSEGYEIWKIVLDTLTETTGTPFAALYERLAAPPYGLPDYMVELYIAAARALRKVYILDKNNTMPVASKALVADITKQKDKAYRVLPVQETEIPYTYVCSVWQAIDEPLGLRHYRELEKNLGRSIDEPRIWFDLKADSNNLLQNRLGQVAERLKSLEADSASFAILMKHLEQTRKLFVPAQGFTQLATLGEELSGAKVSANPDAAALVVRRTIEASEQFLNDWPALQPAYRQYRQLRSAIGTDNLASSAQAVDEAWQAYCADALSPEKRQAFLERFGKLWDQYAEQYADEHKAVTKARAAYGRKAEQSLTYELLGEFSHFGFQGIATRPVFEARINEVRRQSCQVLAEDAMRDYRQFGRTACACGYRLGAGTGIMRQLQESEVSLVASINNALGSYLAKLNELVSSESIQLYAREKATADEKAIIASIQGLAGRGPLLAEAQYRKLKTLLPQFRPIVQVAESYVREQAKKRKELERQLEEEERRKHIPRLPTAQLGDDVRSFLLDSGLEAMTPKELEERLMVWLQVVAKAFEVQAGR